MKICAFGECLIDFTPVGVSENGNTIFERNPGGAPANLAVSAVKQGIEASFIGKIGNDIFGTFLIETLKKEQVDTQYMVSSDRYKTTLAFVQLNEGERSFCFYRNPGADTMIESRELNYQALNECDLFHFGSVSMTHNPSRTTTFELVKLAKSKGKLISYDPNLRLMLWDDEKVARHQILKGMKYCDIVKVADDELLFLTGCTDLQQGARQLMESYHIPLILITEGAAGSHALIHGCYIDAAGFVVETKDTTGAGDGFFGSFLASFLKSGKSLTEISPDEVYNMLRLANATGALAVTKKGAIPSLATTQAAVELMNQEIKNG